jgi:hypothetical protein
MLSINLLAGVRPNRACRSDFARHIQFVRRIRRPDAEAVIGVIPEELRVVLRKGAAGTGKDN